MVDLLYLLKQNNKTLFVLSSDSSSTLDPQINQFGLTGVFNKIYYDVYDKKTEHQKLILENNLDIFKTVTIADTIYELQIGQGLGVSSIGVTWGIHPPEKLASIHPSAIAATIVDLKNLLI